MSLAGDASQPLLTLIETETIFVLSMESSIVANDSKDLDAIKQQNERFIEVNSKQSGRICHDMIYPPIQLRKNRQGSDLFNDRGMNTFNSTVKNKEIQCERLSYQVHHGSNSLENNLVSICRVEKPMLQLLICMIPKEEKVKVGESIVMIFEIKMIFVYDSYSGKKYS